MLQYYTLEEAANLLGLHPDGAKKALDDHKVRQYRDGRGKVRYVASAVDELARTLGRGSDPELALGEAAKPKSGTTPRPSKADDGGTFSFDLPPEDSADVPIGYEKLDDSGSKKSGRSGTKGAGSKSPSPRSPAPKSGSDSDVRLVADSSSELEFQIAADSDVKMVDEGGASSSRAGAAGKSGPRKSPADSHDSEVRIVPMEMQSDSDVRIAEEQSSSIELGRPPGKKHSDSDIRLEEAGQAPRRADEGSDDAHVTEEIDLDAEERKHAEATKAKGKSKMKRAEPKAPPLAATSPFELSEDDLELPKGGKKKPESSSDFELTPAADSDDSVELSSGEIAAIQDADSSEEEVNLGELAGGGAETSGINLDAPADSGISLEGSEGSADDMEFELSLDSGATPKPGPKSPRKQKKPQAASAEDSSSEFELTLDADSSDEQPKLQQAAAQAEDSDSEFELTLDDSGGLVPLEGEQKAAAPAEGEGDIFETDFEVPALDEEESGSEAVALDESDTDLESSDFDLALEEGDAAGEESGSQVVALEDEEEVDAAAETVQKPKKKAAARQAAVDLAGAEEGEALDELASVDDEAAVSEEEQEEAAPSGRRAAPVAAAAAAPTPWGPMPALVLLPCVIVLLLAGFMGYELINTMVGYQQPGKVTGFMAESLAKTFDLDLPKD
jgi:excisionase family DNA binding protein